MNLIWAYFLVLSNNYCYHLRSYSTTSSIIAIGYAYDRNGYVASHHGIFGDEIDCYGSDFANHVGVLFGS